MAGGGIRGGQVHGATDRIGGYPRDGQVEPQDLIATSYRCLGIRPETQIADPPRPPIPDQPRSRHSRDPGLIGGRRVERPPTGLGGGPGTSRGWGLPPAGSGRGKSRRWPGPHRARPWMAPGDEDPEHGPARAHGPHLAQSFGDLAREQADAEEGTGRGQAHAEDLVASTEDEHQGDPGDGEENRNGGRERQGAVEPRHPDRQGDPQARHGRTLGQDRRDHQQDARPSPGGDRIAIATRPGKRASQGTTR